MPLASSNLADHALLKPLAWTPAERALLERTAEDRIRQQLADDAQLLEALQMLGLAPYVSAKKLRNETEPVHGTRAGYVNHGCGKDGSPPCPSTPSCSDENNRYFRERRAARRAAAQPERTAA